MIATQADLWILTVWKEASAAAEDYYLKYSLMCCMIDAVMTDMEDIHLDMKRHLWRDLLDSQLERCRYNTISLSMEDMDVLRMSVQMDLVSDLSSVVIYFATKDMDGPLRRV